MLHKSEVVPEWPTDMLTSAGGRRSSEVGGVHKRVCWGTGSSGSNMGRMQKDEEEEGHEEEDWGHFV